MLWLREMPALGTRLVIRESLARFATSMPNQRTVRHWREALQIAINRAWLVGSLYGVRTEAPLRFGRRAANWSLIACYENLFHASVRTSAMT